MMNDLSGSFFGKFVKIAVITCGVGLHPGSSLAHAPMSQSAPADTILSTSECGKKLANIQKCITSAAQSTFLAGDTTSLVTIAHALRDGIATDRGPSLYYRTYWLAYTDYLTAIIALGTRNLDQVRVTTVEADDLLEKIAIKNQETYALQDLALLLSFVVTPPSDIGPLVSRTLELRTRLGSAPTSIRALYALALADHYTPTQYGGGRVSEDLLRQAMAAPDEPSSLLKPTWGRDDCAGLLIQILQQAGDTEQANRLFALWHRKYPNSIALAQLSGKL